MTILYTQDDKFREITRDAYRSYLISRNQAPIVYHSGNVHLKRLRVLARVAMRRIRAGVKRIHLAIVAGKVRRLQRELALQDIRYDYPFAVDGTPEPAQPEKKHVQTPMILGEKWDF